ncbi:YhfC family intramembrane metalloprotease [Geobacillus thermodenitrificans]|uniref:YhfC family intramembrane metalloprotease n=1 Tax=Geobacillus thermodenitrificans TaxID=33940 RepID=A0ABY9Q9R5_GEOTD|nr:YhfC family intramembrane metalloprotease [Geobacillus thermodenitrificans]PJW19623.1 YhfC family intramembrane metalloprotease [Geobacillus thermodenitrificans]WMV74936.1 YhfC family intramembrane metalloprotease [Geobacillus thermodenitrificans]
MGIIGAVTQLLVSLLVPLGLVWYGRKKGWLSWKALGIGALIFLVFSQVLEKALHIAVLEPGRPALKGTESVTLFVLYAALAAGVFEEIGRYVGFRWLLKQKRSYGDGLSFGLGHGGVEAVLLGVLGAVNVIVLMSLIQSGVFDKTIAPSLPADQAELIKEQVLHTPLAMYVLGGLERLFALAVHVALSLLVLLGVRKRQFRYVLYAILLHAALDVLPALYQAKVVTNIWVVEAVLLVWAVAAVLFIRWIKPAFEQGEEKR